MARSGFYLGQSGEAVYSRAAQPLRDESQGGALPKGGTTNSNILWPLNGLLLTGRHLI